VVNIWKTIAKVDIGKNDIIFMTKCLHSIEDYRHHYFINKKLNMTSIYNHRQQDNEKFWIKSII